MLLVENQKDQRAMNHMRHQGTYFKTYIVLEVEKYFIHFDRNFYVMFMKVLLVVEIVESNYNDEKFRL